MPSNLVKTKSDEKKWDKAKELAKKAVRKKGIKNKWAYTTGIYKKMKGMESITPYNSIFKEK